MAVKPKVLVVGAGPFQLELLRAVQREDAYLIAADGNDRAPGLALADEAVVCNICDHEAVLALARRHRVDAVLSAASDVAAPTMAYVAQAMGLYGLSFETVAQCRNKLTSANCVREAHLWAPETIRVKTAGEALQWAEHFGATDDDALNQGGKNTEGEGKEKRIVLKPMLGAGGRGVTVVHHRDEIEPAFLRAQAVCKNGVLAQRYVEGRSIGVEAFFTNGGARLFLMDDGYREGFVSPAGHRLPADIDDGIRQLLHRSIEAMGRALGITDGPANFDLRVADGRVWLIEVNPRLGGCGISRLIKDAYGVDLPQMLVRRALGREVDFSHQREQGAATRLVMKRGQGRMTGYDRWLQMQPQGVRDSLSILSREGEIAGARSGDWSILGSVFTTAPTATEAWDRACALTDEIEQAVTLTA